MDNQTLNERIASMAHDHTGNPDHVIKDELKQLIKEVLEYVKPVRLYTDYANSELNPKNHYSIQGRNEAIDEMEANQRKLGL